MTQSEMSYAPAYYQDTGQFIPAHRLESGGTPPASVPAAYPPPAGQSLPRHYSLDGRDELRPPEPSSVQNLPNHLSDPLAGSYHHRFPISPQPLRPHSAQRSIVPASFAASSRLENDSILDGSPNSNGPAGNESRTRGSLTGHSSFMSTEVHSPHGVPHVQKQAFQRNEDRSANDGEDGLLMLFNLSFSVPVFSLAAAIYAVFALFFVFVTSPLRLCSLISKSTSFSSRLCGLLAPALHVHERLVRSPRLHFGERRSSTQWVYNDSPPPELDPGECYSAGGLIAVLVLSPFLCGPLLLATWTVACFWIFAKMLGNPDGTERRDDGRTAVLGVAHMWQRWLGTARRSP